MTSDIKKEKKEERHNVLKDENLYMVFAVTLLSVLGVASVTPAFPQIAIFFNISPAKTGLIVSAFTIPGIIATPLLGLLADTCGRKKILVPCLFLFGLSGVMCAFSRTFNELLFMRVLQGMGASALNSLNITIIGDLYQKRLRTEAMGYNSSVLGVGTAIYPALGGLLSMLGWRYPFLLPIAAIPVALWVMLRLKQTDLPKHKASQPFRKMFQAFSSPMAILLFSTSTVTFIILYGAFLTFLPFYLNSNFQATALQIGLISAFMSLSSAIVAFNMKNISKMLSERVRLSFAFVLYCLALIIALYLPNCLSALIPAGLMGAAQGLNMPTLMTMITNIAPEGNRAAFISLNSMSLRLGQTIGPFLMGIIYSLLGINYVFSSGAILAGTMSAVLYFALKKSPNKPRLLSNNSHKN